jgi:hypothetical protein
VNFETPALAIFGAMGFRGVISPSIVNFALCGLGNRVTSGEVNLTHATLHEAEFGFWCYGEKVFEDLTMTFVI